MSYPKSRLGKLFIKKADLLRELDSVLNAIEDDLESLSGGIRTINFPIAIAAIQDSLTPIPANAVVYSCMVQVVTPYTGGTVIAVGRVGSLSLLQSASDNLPTAANLYQAVQRTPWGVAQLPVRVSVAGAPIAGDGYCVISYSLPNP